MPLFSPRATPLPRLRAADYLPPDAAELLIHIDTLIIASMTPPPDAKDATLMPFLSLFRQTKVMIFHDFSHFSFFFFFSLFRSLMVCLHA